MNLPIFMAVDENLAQKIAKDIVKPMLTTTADGSSYWLEGDEYYFQNWAWFAALIYQGDAQKIGW